MTSTSASTSLRSHTCGELRAAEVGERVTLSGWVHRRRDHGHLTFFDLRDRHGITQVVTSSDDAPDAHAAGEAARNEWVVQVSGTVRARPAGTTNAELPTGEIEVAVDGLTILNPSRVPPFYVNEEQPGLDESLRLKHRYLDLRRPAMQERILMRSRLAVAIRRALDDEGFVEIETPTLIRSTPETCTTHSLRAGSAAACASGASSALVTTWTMPWRSRRSKKARWP